MHHQLVRRHEVKKLEELENKLQRVFSRSRSEPPKANAKTFTEIFQHIMDLANEAVLPIIEEFEAQEALIRTAEEAQIQNQKLFEKTSNMGNNIELHKEINKSELNESSCKEEE